MANEQKNLVVTNTGVYDVVLFDRDKTVPEYGKAYILNEDYRDDDIFYFYRGRLKNDSTEPGIYIGENELVEIIEPEEDERKDYIIKTHFANMNPGDMMVILKDKSNIKHVISEKSKLYVPEPSEKDNILKRALKQAFQCKEVSIDECKDGFTDRNAFFNFSSQMRSDTGSISFLLMDRGCTALRLGYAIVLYELDPDNPVGRSLEDPEVIAEYESVPKNVTNPIVDEDQESKPVINLTGKIVVSSEDSFKV